jgi:ATP phosphoribosyltransferase
MKIAVPNKGSLADASIQVLKEVDTDNVQIRADLSSTTDAENGVEFYYLRPRDMALYVGSGE